MIPIKTPRGQAELTASRRSVSQRHRTVLFLIDGKRSAAEVRDMAGKAGVPESAFGELIEMGMVLLSEPTVVVAAEPPRSEPGALDIDLPLPGPESTLPPARSLFPESSMDSTLGAPTTTQAWLNADSGAFDAPDDDPIYVEARLLLVRAVRTHAPVAGTLTLLKLRRARTRADLAELLDEVEARISRPHRSLAATHTMHRVRQMLGRRADTLLHTA